MGELTFPLFQKRFLVCGNRNGCSENEKTVEKTDVHAVRCCRDESHGGSGGWPFKCKNDSEATYSSSSGPWGQSRMGSIPDDIVGSVTNTCVSLTGFSLGIIRFETE